MVRLYCVGLLILVVAIVANGVVVKLGLLSWYDFIKLLTEKGIEAFSDLNILDHLWLFLGYPLVLGLGYLAGDKLYMTVFG